MDEETRSQAVWEKADVAIRLGRSLEIAGVVVRVLAIVAPVLTLLSVSIDDNSTISWPIVGLTILYYLFAFVAGLGLSLYGVRGQLHGFEVQDRVLNDDLDESH